MPLSDARERDDAANRVAGRSTTAGDRRDGKTAQPHSPQPPATAETFWQRADQWLRRSLAIITESAPALDAMNVFPVADADTGANLRLTLSCIDRSVQRLDAQTVTGVAASAIQAAHGNSGAIVAEMISAAARFQPPSADTPGEQLAGLLAVTAAGATQAVARPSDGTILSVARVAAEGARHGASAEPLAVAEAARAAAAAELAQTVSQLPALRQANVVDAGAQAYVLLLDVLVEVLGGAPAESLPAGPDAPVDQEADDAVRASTGNIPRPTTAAAAPGAGLTTASVGGPGTDYEVMYTLRGADRETLSGLRKRLDSIGNSVVVVGDQTLAQVHVHLPDAGAAIQPALGLGELSQIKITALPGEVRSRPRRTVISIVAGQGLAEAVESGGGTALPAADAPHSAAALAGLLAADTEELIILPNDMEQLEIAYLLSRRTTGDSRRVWVIPTVAQAQGLAALAVHEATASFDDAVSAMTQAAFATRHGAITIAEAAVTTLAGRCRAGDVLGAVNGDATHVGSDPADVGWQVIVDLVEGVQAAACDGPATAASLTEPPAELLTVIIGADGSVELAHQLGEQARSRYPGIEVQVLFGGQQRYLLLIGVE